MGKTPAKFLTVLILMIALGCFLPVVSADCGPKSNFTHVVVGMEERAAPPGLMFYSATAVEAYSSAEMAEYGWENNPLKVALNGYRDPDGFVLLSLYWPLMHEGIPTMYYWPSEVKCAVIDLDGNVFISEAIVPRMFYAELVFDFEGVVATGAITFAGTASERFPIVRIALDFILRLGGTLAIELAVLWLFGYRETGSVKAVLIVNLITQTILTLGVLDGHYVVGDVYGAIVVLLAGELLVFVAESIVYARVLTERSRPKAIAYAVAANAASFLLSLLVIVVPGWDWFF